jgi:hypothetical protein
MAKKVVVIFIDSEKLLKLHDEYMRNSTKYPSGEIWDAYIKGFEDCTKMLLDSKLGAIRGE